MLLRVQLDVPVPCRDEILQDVHDWMWDIHGINKVDSNMESKEISMNEEELSKVCIIVMTWTNSDRFPSGIHSIVWCSMLTLALYINASSIQSIVNIGISE